MRKLSRILTIGLIVLFSLTETVRAEIIFAPEADAPVTPSLAPMVEEVSSGIVSVFASGITDKSAGPLSPFDPFFGSPFGFPQPDRMLEASGSGVVIDAEAGLVLTNAHVVMGAETITVRLTSGQEVTATVKGADPETDVAALVVEAEGLHSLTIGDPRSLRVGDYVVAVGNPFGLEGSVTAGIVSALGRNDLGIEGYENFIQIDAPINPGNSGGALVNLRGELVGINTATAGPGSGNVGIGFAIPIDMALQAALQLVETGRVDRAQIGVTVQLLEPVLAEAMGLEGYRGVLVSEVHPRSPAEAAGLVAGDLIVSVDDEPMDEPAELRLAIGLRRPGTVVSLGVVHDGELESIAVTLVSRDSASLPASESDSKPHGAAILEGALLRPVEQGAGLDGMQGGVQVMELDPASALGAAGLRPGDIIVEAADRPIRTPDDLAEIAEGTSGPVVLRVYRDGRSLFAALA